MPNKDRKQFLWRENWNHYWEPSSDNIPKLELLYNKLLQREHKRQILLLKK